MTLQLIHNNAYDKLVLRDATGVAVSCWLVSGKEFGDFITAAADPASLSDWDIQEHDGVGNQSIEDYGDLVASVTAAGLVIEDEHRWEGRCEFYGQRAQVCS